MLLVIAIIASVLMGGLAAPIFWILSPVLAYFDAKTYNVLAGYPESLNKK